MDIFCTEKSMEALKQLSPDDIDYYLDTYDSPSGHIFVTDEMDTAYLMAKTDFQDTSRLIESDEQYMSIEYFENGIPEWLEPIPGTRYYLAEWTGSEWHFEKVAGI